MASNSEANQKKSWHGCYGNIRYKFTSHDFKLFRFLCIKYFNLLTFQQNSKFILWNESQ
jgi:hypothetical protein